jgi:hypothetical protein
MKNNTFLTKETLFLVESRNTSTEKIREYHWINSLIPASDHGADYTCKIVIEVKMCMPYTWCIAQQLI